MEHKNNDWYPLLKKEKKGLNTSQNKWRILENLHPKASAVLM